MPGSIPTALPSMPRPLVAAWPIGDSTLPARCPAPRSALMPMLPTLETPPFSLSSDLRANSAALRLVFTRISRRRCARFSPSTILSSRLEPDSSMTSSLARRISLSSDSSGYCCFSDSNRSLILICRTINALDLLFSGNSFSFSPS